MAKKNKEVTTLGEVVGIMLKAFDSNQKYMDKGFRSNREYMDKRFDKIENLLIEEQNRKIEKLESRIEYLENILNLPAKN